MRETWVRSLGWEDPLEKEMATHSSILAWRIPLEGGAWWATIHGVAKSRTRLSDFTHSVFEPGIKMGLITYIGLLLPLGTSGKEPALPCRRQEFDSWARKIAWRRAWQFTPVFLPGESHGQRNLAGYSPWGHRESDTTEWAHRTCIIVLSFMSLQVTSRDFSSGPMAKSSWAQC